MRLLCPAKINLHLRVGPVRRDGYHAILSWFAAVGLFDTLTIQPRENASPSADAPISLTCSVPALPVDGANLVVKAAILLADRARQAGGGLPRPVQAHLEKRIPHGAGLGGGSSDGARALLGLSRLWRLGMSDAELAELSARLGSDLPFFFHGPSSICSGRGEGVHPTPKPKPAWALLLLPGVELPTASVYRAFDQMSLGRTEDIEDSPDWRGWAELPARELLANLVNDLEPAAFAINPALGAMRLAAEKLLERPVRMSGSGSSLFTLTDSEDEASFCNERLNRLSLHSEVVGLAPQIADDLATT